MNTWKRRFGIPVVILAISYLVSCVYIWAEQINIIFDPSPALPTTPARMGMAFEEVLIPVGNHDKSSFMGIHWAVQLALNLPRAIPKPLG
jgi:hypothetical protein